MPTIALRDACRLDHGQARRGAVAAPPAWRLGPPRLPSAKAPGRGNGVRGALLPPSQPGGREPSPASSSLRVSRSRRRSQPFQPRKTMAGGSRRDGAGGSAAPTGGGGPQAHNQGAASRRRPGRRSLTRSAAMGGSIRPPFGGLLKEVFKVARVCRPRIT